MFQFDLKTLLGLKELEKLLKDYSRSNGLDLTLYDKAGEALFVVRGNGCVCDYAKKPDICREKVIFAGRKAQELNEPYIYETPCGLVMCIVSIVLNKEAVGFISVGPVILWDNDEHFQEEFRQRNTQQQFFSGEIDPSTIKQMDSDAMMSLARVLTLLVNYLVEEKHKYFIRCEESDWFNWELLKEREEKETFQEIDCNCYPIEMEQQLINYVCLGDKANVRKLISSFLNEILLYANGDLVVVNAKLYGLIAFLMNVAIELEVPMESLKAILKDASRILRENIDFTDLCQITVDILEKYIDIVCAYKKSMSAHLASAIKYIQTHYSENLNLSILAGKVFVSTYYLSHLFRNEMKTTFSNYLNKVRIDAAKRYLAGGESVTQTCTNVGYNNVSYFNKTFKKIVGIKPAEYVKVLRNYDSVASSHGEEIVENEKNTLKQ